MYNMNNPSAAIYTLASTMYAGLEYPGSIIIIVSGSMVRQSQEMVLQVKKT